MQVSWRSDAIVTAIWALLVSPCISTEDIDPRVATVLRSTIVLLSFAAILYAMM
jgi:hypothetical protein